MCYGKVPSPFLPAIAMIRLIMLFVMVVTLLETSHMSAQSKSASSAPDAAELTRMAARFAPTPLKVDTSGLSPGDKRALVKLVEAAPVAGALRFELLSEGRYDASSKRTRGKRDLKPKHKRRR